MIDKMSGRVALIIVAGAILAIMLLGWFVLLNPERSKATMLNGQIADVNSELAAVTSLLNGPVGKQSLAALRVSKIAIPDDPNVSQVIRQLSTAAAQTGVELDSITPAGAVASGSGQAIPFGITVKGHYFALQRLFRVLRTRAMLQGDKLLASGRLYTVDSISFAGGAASTTGSGQTGGSASVVSATLTLTAYAFAPGPGLPPTTAAPPTSDASTATTTSP